MAGAVAYFHSSAFVKLVVAEPGSPARFAARLRAGREGTVDVAAHRDGPGTSLLGERRADSGRAAIEGRQHGRIDEQLLDRAADLEPDELRTLDAIHLASALQVGQDLGVMIAHDSGLKAAAQAYGPIVESPN